MAALTRRWLIVGPYPPERGSGAEAAAEFVAERLAAGDTVHAVSPRPTAAHVHHDLDGLRGLRTLWQIARQQRAKALWLRVEPGIVLRNGVDRRRALIERVVLALLLRRFETTVLDVGDIGLLPGGRAGRPVLVAASRFVAHREQDAAALIANGAAEDRIEKRFTAGKADRAMPLTDAPAIETAPADYPAPTALLDLPADRSAIEAAVRHRADQLRQARADAAAAVIEATAPDGA
jgi:hypothetical protein